MSTASEAVLTVEKLAKTFKKPFSGKKVEAVRGVSFEVKKGEIFGFLGPNGAGKTTTIKMLMGLIAPTSGKAMLLGRPIPSPDAMGSIGFLPESPYVYPYLTPREFVSLCGRLNGLTGKKLEKETEKAIERCGIGYAIDRPVRALSKGMLQRTGFAGALVHDPEFLILDEPMSGLDPVGRKDVRDLIVEESGKGKTIFFSSHILSDVELLCDSICILKKGEVVVSGQIDALLDKDSKRSEIVLKDPPADFLEGVTTLKSDRIGQTLSVEIEGDTTALLRKALDAGVHVESITPKRESLEDIFVRKAL